MEVEENANARSSNDFSANSLHPIILLMICVKQHQLGSTGLPGASKRRAACDVTSDWTIKEPDYEDHHESVIASITCLRD